MLNRQIKFALHVLAAGDALLGTAAVAGSWQCVFSFRVVIWFIASFDEDVLLWLSWMITIVPSKTSLILELFAEVCERVVE